MDVPPTPPPMTTARACSTNAALLVRLLCGAYLVADRGALVGERAVGRVELPAVLARAERQLEDAMRDRRADEAVRRIRVGERPERRTAGADDELADAVRIRVRRRVLRREALVVVVVAVDDDVGAGRNERLPERPGDRVAAVKPRREARMVPDRECAAGVACREVRGEPAALLGIGTAAANLRAVGVEHDDVPGREVIRIPGLPIVVRRRRAEVAE